MTEIGKEYGTALFMLACEEDAKKEFSRGLELISTAFLNEPDYVAFLSSPGIPLNDRLTAIAAAFGGSVPEHLVSFLQLLCERGRITCFADAAETYGALLNVSEHVSSAKVTSAVALTEEEKQKLKHKLELTCKGSVNLEYAVDEALLGGLIVEIDGTVMDGSLRHRLHEVKEVIST